MTTRVAIVGSRDFERPDVVRHLVAELDKHYSHDWLLVSGGARGVDSMAERTAFDLGVKRHVFIPDWSIGRHAGFLRNEKIVANADVVYALFADGPPSRGTSHTVDLAKKANKRLHIYHEGKWTTLMETAPSPTLWCRNGCEAAADNSDLCTKCLIDLGTDD